MKNNKLETGDEFKVKFTTAVERTQTLDGDGKQLAVPNKYFQQNFVVVKEDGSEDTAAMNAIKNSGFQPRVRSASRITNHVGTVRAVFKGEERPGENNGTVAQNSFTNLGSQPGSELAESKMVSTYIADVNGEW